MKPFILFLTLSLGIGTASAQTLHFTSENDQVSIVCNTGHKTESIASIKSIDIKFPATADTVVAIGMYRDMLLFLHLHAQDTSLFVRHERSNYYLYALANDNTEESQREDLICLYRNVRYPVEARRKSKSGTTLTSTFLDESGHVIKAVAASDLGYGLEDATLSAVRKCSFAPGSFAGISVKTFFEIPMTFRLE